MSTCPCQRLPDTKHCYYIIKSRTSCPSNQVKKNLLIVTLYKWRHNLRRLLLSALHNPKEEKTIRVDMMRVLNIVTLRQQSVPVILSHQLLLISWCVVSDMIWLSGWRYSQCQVTDSTRWDIMRVQLNY